MSECHEKEETYVNAVQNYFGNLTTIEKNKLKRIMRREFTTAEQQIEGRVIIEDCAKNLKKLNKLDFANLPFGLVKMPGINGSRCEDETNILETWRRDNADCLPVWYNLRDRVEFYESCLISEDIQSYRRLGKDASDKLQSLAFDLHKHEKQNAYNRIGGGSAMISGGIMAGIGVLLTPITAGGSLALSVAGGALSLSGSLATLFGPNPTKYVSDSMKEMKELQDRGNSISALLLLYMVSHDELEKFVHNNHHYRTLIAKYERDIHRKLQLESASAVFQSANLALLSRKIIPSTTFSKSVKEFGSRQISRITKPLENVFRRSLPTKLANMKSTSSLTRSLVPKLFRNSKALNYVKQFPRFPGLAGALSIGLGIWEVIEGTKGLEKGMHHQVKLASRKTLLIVDEVVEAYLHIMKDSIDVEKLKSPEGGDEAITVVYVHVGAGHWDYLSGMHLRFESNGRQCVTGSRKGISEGWIELDSREDLGECYRWKIKNDSLTVSVTSEQSSIFTDELTIDAVQVATEGRFLPSFKTNDSLQITISGSNVSSESEVYHIKNRLVGIKTHTSTKAYSGTDAKIMARITYIVPNDGNEIMDSQKLSSEIELVGGFENDQTDVFRENIFKLGLEEFLDNHPIGNISSELKEGDIKISFKSNGGGLAPDWNVDLIKMYFIGLQGEHVVYTCHTGEKWITHDKDWYNFPCELHRPENPRISIEQLKLSVCDEYDAGSTSNRVQFKFCRNAADFDTKTILYTPENSKYLTRFEKAVAEKRCCATNYFSPNGDESYDRGETATIDGNSFKDDGGEKLGQCEGFEITKSEFSMVVNNEATNGVCFNNIQLYGNNDKALTSSLYPIPFRTCGMPNVWADSSTSMIQDDHLCSSYHDHDDARSQFRCHMNSKINFSSLKIGLCNRNYAASYDPFTVTICDENIENCCTTDNLNTDEIFSTYGSISEGSYIKEIHTLRLGTCKDKLLSDTVSISINMQGSDKICVNYFELGEKFEGNLNPQTSTTCQHSEVWADTNQVKICPRYINPENAPVHCRGTDGNTLQKIGMKVSDRLNAGSSDDIKLTIRNSDGNECETNNFKAAASGHYIEYSNVGDECKKLQISDFVNVWVATINHNDNLFLTHLYLDVADENGTTKQMACLLDQSEEFFVIVHGDRKRFGVPLKCM